MSLSVTRQSLDCYSIYYLFNFICWDENPQKITRKANVILQKFLSLLCVLQLPRKLEFLSNMEEGGLDGLLDPSQFESVEGILI